SRIYLFSSYCYPAYPDLHSFPTRRSSDLTFFITGILSVGSFMILQRILTFELIGEDYLRIFTVGVLLHVIFLECLAILEQIIHRSEEHTSELQSRFDLVCRLLLEKKNKKI